MHPNINTLQRIFWVYGLCFLGWLCYLFSTESLLVQAQPAFIKNQLDLTLNLILSSGIHPWLMEHPFYFWLLDIFFIGHPILLFISIRNPKLFWFAWIVICYNLFYALLASSYTPCSIQVWVGWFLIPLIFTAKTENARKLFIEGLRYAFLLIFLSAGVWKIRAGGIFEPEIMSGILITQHATELAYFPNGRYMEVIRWLIGHPLISYSLYALATISELLFAVGFFTKKWDKILCWALILFIIFDLALMRINYSPWLAFVAVFWAANQSKVTDQNT